jgi:hypothetical protein
LRSASSKPLWLLLSAVAAFGVLAWSAQRGPHYPTPYVAWVTMAPGSTATATYTYDAAGQGYFGRVPPTKVVSGFDTFSRVGRKLVCTTVVLSRGKPYSITVYPCASGGRQIPLRRVP